MIDSIIPFILAHGLLGYGLAYVHPSSALRSIILSFIILCCLISVRSTISQQVPGLIGNEYIVGFILHASNFLTISKLSPPTHSTKRSRARWAFDQLFDARWGAKYVPHFYTNDPKAIPSRLSFLARRVVESACLTLIIYIVQSYPLNIVAQDFLEVPDGFLHRLGSITLREMIIRVYIYFTSTYIPYCTLRLAHSLASILAVISGDTPERWPPLFGSLSEAYTVRRFYACFWHQLMRKAFTSHAVYIVTRLLRVAPRSKVSRYLILFVSFLLAALLHILASPEPFRCSIWPQSLYYLSTALAIVAEDTAMAFTLKLRSQTWTKKAEVEISRKAQSPRRLTASDASEKHPNDHRQCSLFPKRWRIVGYCWVFLFDMWATSKLVYASAVCW